MGICVSRLFCSADCLINYNIPGNKGGDGEPGEVTPNGVTSRLLPEPIGFGKRACEQNSQNGNLAGLKEYWNHGIFKFHPNQCSDY